MRFLSSLLLALASAMPFALASDTEELKIEVTRSVECTRKTKAGDTVEVHYRGTLASDGSEFDASYNRGTPLSFKLGAGRVIKGWDQGLLDMCIGEARTLTIPSNLAYGDQGRPPVIPPKATLSNYPHIRAFTSSSGPANANGTPVFTTELMGIKGVSKDEL